MKLTNIKCQNAKPEDKAYKLFDGGGLFLLVNPKGSKLWRLKYHFLGKEKLMALGSYPILSLADARQKRDDAKRLLAQDTPIDPMASKKQNRDELVKNAQNSFKAIALEWHDNNKGSWSEGYADKVIRRLEMNIFPYIGFKPIADITPPELLDCLRKVEKRGASEIALRIKQLCGMIFRYGIDIQFL